MSKCYSCEFKQYKHGDQVPKFDGTCPDDCVILYILQALGAGMRTMPKFASLVIAEYPALVELLKESGALSDAQLTQIAEASRQ